MDSISIILIGALNSIDNLEWTKVAVEANDIPKVDVMIFNSKKDYCVLYSVESNKVYKTPPMQFSKIVPLLKINPTVGLEIREGECTDELVISVVKSYFKSLKTSDYKIEEMEHALEAIVLEKNYLMKLLHLAN
jgi:hypothetical protein